MKPLKYFHMVFFRFFTINYYKTLGIGERGGRGGGVNEKI